MTRVCVVFGTRPEVIKLAPVCAALRDRPCVETVVVNAGQHRQLLTDALSAFDLHVDVSLDVMRPGQKPEAVLSRLVGRLAAVMRDIRPEWVLVQGDTSTCLAAALAGFYLGSKIAHVEAGLRTAHPRQPFPEEMHRRLVDTVADLLFAPSARARAALLREGIPEEAIVVTGNTIVDAVRMAADHVRSAGVVQLPPELRQTIRDSEPLLVLTLHRRESFGQPMREVLAGVQALLDQHPGATVVFPAHPNPSVRNLAAEFRGRGRFLVVEPLGYLAMVELLLQTSLLITDSGGLQEEAAVLGIPTVIARDVTERPEVLSTGFIDLGGRDRHRIYEKGLELLEWRRRSVPRYNGCLGDGKASQRIVASLLSYTSDREHTCPLKSRPLPGSLYGGA